MSTSFTKMFAATLAVGLMLVANSVHAKGGGGGNNGGGHSGGGNSSRPASSNGSSGNSGNFNALKLQTSNQNTVRNITTIQNNGNNSSPSNTGIVNPIKLKNVVNNNNHNNHVNGGNNGSGGNNILGQNLSNVVKKNTLPTNGLTNTLHNNNNNHNNNSLHTLSKQGLFQNLGNGGNGGNKLFHKPNFAKMDHHCKPHCFDKKCCNWWDCCWSRCYDPCWSCCRTPWWHNDCYCYDTCCCYTPCYFTPVCEPVTTCVVEVSVMCDACNIGTYSTQTVSYVTPAATTGVSVLQGILATGTPAIDPQSPEGVLKLMGL